VKIYHVIQIEFDQVVWENAQMIITLPTKRV